MQLFIGNMCRAMHRTLAGRVKKKIVVNGPRWVYWLVINTSVDMPGKRESQPRNYLHLVGIPLEGFLKLLIDGGMSSPLWAVWPLCRWF